MKQIIHNNDNLTEKDINNQVDRVKLLIINSDDQILLGYSHHTYQFPGGHVEGDEPLMTCLSRELMEETGIELINLALEPFFHIQYFSKDYPEVGNNTLFNIYYYVVHTDLKPDLTKINLTEHEAEGNFKLEYIDMENIEKILTENIPLNSKNEVIVPEMLEVIRVYKKIKIML